MSTAPAVACTLLGSALVAAALRDAFDALFHTEGKGALSRGVMRGIWAVWRRVGRRRPQSVSLAGPTALVAVVTGWAGLLILGWTFIYWPHITGFHAPPDDALGFADALYFSMVTMSTIGFGDVTPATDALRVLAPIEAFLGFGLLTATISWLLGVHPALSRRRSLSYEISLLREAERDLGPLEQREGAALVPLLAELTSRLVAVERDLVTFPVSYYFRERDERFSLAVAMPWLLALAERCSGPAAPRELRLRALMLRAAIEDFGRTAAVRAGSAPANSPSDLVAAYARDHRVGPAVAS